MSIQEPNFRTIIGNLCLPSLQDTCMLTIVKHELDIKQEEIHNMFFREFNVMYHTSCLSSGSMSELVSLFESIPIPEVIHGQFISFVAWIIDQLKDWICFIWKKMAFNTKIFESIAFDTFINLIKWNVAGTINYHRSIEQLLEEKILKKDDIFFPFTSRYCLEEYIKMSWSELSADEKKGIFIKEKENIQYCFELYWACIMTGKMEQFLKFALKFMQLKKNCYQEVLNLEMNFLNDADNCAFVLALAEGSPIAVKYFGRKLTNIDKDFICHLIKIYLKPMACGKKPNHEKVDVLFFLLNLIQDDELSEKIFREYFMVFLRLSTKYWPCHKYLGDFIEMSAGSMDYKLYYEILAALTYDVKEENCKSMLVRSLWRKMPNEMKKKFCSFISNINKENLDLINLWEHLNIDIMNLFLKDEEFLKTSSPYENNGILELILSGKYEIVDCWLEKCLVSNKAITSFLVYFFKTKSVPVIKILQKSSINHVYEFVNWALNHDKIMYKDDFFEVAGELIWEVCGHTFYRGIELEKWDDLEKLMDLILKDRYDYDDKLIILKKKGLRVYFNEIAVREKKWGKKDFVEGLYKFICYGIKDTGKLKTLLNDIHLCERRFCVDWLNESDWLSINSFLTFANEYGGDILKIKKDFFFSVIAHFDEYYFQQKKLCDDIDKFLYWNSKDDPNIKEKIWEIKKLRANAGVSLKFVLCICKPFPDAITNLLTCFFKEGFEDEKFREIAFDLKKSVLDYNQVIEAAFCASRYNCISIARLINWGGNCENHRKDIWYLKKYFIEKLIRNQQDKRWCILRIITEQSKIFLSTFFGGHKNESDFEKTLWNFKENFIKKILNFSVNFHGNIDILICELFEKFKEFNEFLTWNGYNETGLKNLKQLILNEKGVSCILHWISKNNFIAIKTFLDWYDDTIEIKKSVIKEIANNSTITYNWQKLQSFLNYGFKLNNENDIKNYLEFKSYIFQFYGVDICYNWILKNKWDELPLFLTWVFETLENENLEEFKAGLIKIYGADYCNARILENDWEKLEKFLIWGFGFQEENNEIDEKIIDLKIKTLTGNISYKNHLKTLMLFLEWGFKSKARLTIFKKDILKKTHPLNYLISESEYKSEKEFQLWFVGNE